MLLQDIKTAKTIFVSLRKTHIISSLHKSSTGKQRYFRSGNEKMLLFKTRFVAIASGIVFMSGHLCVTAS